MKAYPISWPLLLLATPGFAQTTTAPQPSAPASRISRP